MTKLSEFSLLTEATAGKYMSTQHLSSS